MSSVITNPINNIPSNPKSHVAGWAQIWADQLGAEINRKCTPDIKNYDYVYIEHGVNFGGTLNLFGGATKEVFDRINLVASCKNIISLDWDMPDFGAMLKKRIGANTTYEGITEEWCDAMSLRFANTPSLKQQDLITDSLLNGITLGDSHTIAFSDRYDIVLRNDGKTLYGALNEGIENLFRGVAPTGRITLCFGSIDIRHHILRHDDFDLKSFIQKYVDQGKEIEDKYNCDIYYAAPVPVEHEERRIPKSGFYKKTAFYGSQQERADLTNKFIDQLDLLSGYKVVMPPYEWYTMNPELYAKTYMEHGSSFHIAPPYHRRNDWGKVTTGLEAFFE